MISVTSNAVAVVVAKEQTKAAVAVVAVAKEQSKVVVITKARTHIKRTINKKSTKRLHFSI
jgi:hypothetical protein